MKYRMCDSWNGSQFRCMDALGEVDHVCDVFTYILVDVSISHISGNMSVCVIYDVFTFTSVNVNISDELYVSVCVIVDMFTFTSVNVNI